MDEKLTIMFVAGLIYGATMNILFDLFVYPLKRKWRRQCNYDCSKCKVWDCDRHYCLKQKNKDERKENENE